MKKEHEKYMRRAVALAQQGMESNAGGPFGCVIVKDGKIVGEGHNRVLADKDPTAHAEIVAIRDACRNLSDFQLEGCTLYASCEPCPMCLGAIYWARPKEVFYALTKEDAAGAGFDDHFIYEEIEKPMHIRSIKFEKLMRNEAAQLFQYWKEKQDKSVY